VLRTIIQEDGDVDLVNVYDIATKPAMSVPPSSKCAMRST
jgi:hypothetical protein